MPIWWWNTGNNLNWIACEATPGSGSHPSLSLPHRAGGPSATSAELTRFHTTAGIPHGTNTRRRGTGAAARAGKAALLPDLHCNCKWQTSAKVKNSSADISFPLLIRDIQEKPEMPMLASTPHWQTDFARVMSLESDEQGVGSDSLFPSS